MVVYFLLIIYIVLMHCLIGDATILRRKRYCISVFLALFLIQALRSPEVGVDLTVYRSTFDVIKNFSLSGAIDYGNQLRMEPGLPICFWFVGKVLQKWQWVIIFTSLFINGVVCRFAYKTTEKPMLFFLIYIGLGLFVFSFSGLRQMIAIAFSMIAYMKFSNEKYLSFFFFVLLGMLFHISAIVMLAVVIINKLKFSKRMLVFIMMLYLIILVFGKTIAEFVVLNFFPRYSNYLHESNDFGYLGLFYVMTFIMLYIMNYNKNEITNSKLLFLVALAACFQMFGNITSVTARITMYFVPYIGVVLSNSLTVESIGMTVKAKKVLSILYCAFIIMFLFIPEILSGYLNVVPYKFFW